MNTQLLSYNESRTRSNQRAHILQEAFELFLTNGIERVNMQDISAACKIQRRSLYNYYSSKDEIAMDLMRCWYIERTAWETQSAARICAKGGNALEQMRTLLYEQCDYIYANAEAITYTVHFDHYFKDGFKEFPSYEQFVTQLLRKSQRGNLIRLGIADGSISPVYVGKELKTQLTMSSALFALAQRILFRSDVLHRETSYALENIRLLADLLLNGIKA